MKRIVFGFLSIALLGVACNDNNMDEIGASDFSLLDLSSEETVASALEDADVISDAGFDSFSEASGRGIRDEILDCAAVTHDTINNVITIDYGEDGCEGRRGRLRKGKIIIEYQGRRFAVGAFRRVTFEDFSVDSTYIEGTRTHTVTSVDADAGTVTVDITLEGGKITFDDGTFATRDASRTRVWNQSDGTTRLTGSASGVNREGENYSMVITEELVFARDCWGGRVFVPVSGIKAYTVGENSWTLDYGDGACDNLATVTNGDVTEEIVITLRGRRRS